MSTTYTHHEIRAAILRAADRVEREPSCYDFGAVATPPDCGTPACMIGWIGFELGAKPGLVVNNLISELRNGDPVHGFLKHAGEMYDVCNLAAPGYQWNASQAAAGMRAYAEKYWPASAASAASAETTTPMDPAYLAFRAGLGALTGVEVGS